MPWPGTGTRWKSSTCRSIALNDRTPNASAPTTPPTISSAPSQMPVFDVVTAPMLVRRAPGVSTSPQRHAVVVAILPRRTAGYRRASWMPMQPPCRASDSTRRPHPRGRRPARRGVRSPQRRSDHTPPTRSATRGDQHVDFPAWDSQTHAAPWTTVGSVGDVNGDGLEDIAVGFAAPWRRSAIHVVFSDRLGGLVAGPRARRASSSRARHFTGTVSGCRGTSTETAALTSPSRRTTASRSCSAGPARRRSTPTTLGDGGFHITGVSRFGGNGGGNGLLRNDGLLSPCPITTATGSSELMVEQRQWRLDRAPPPPPARARRSPATFPARRWPRSRTDLQGGLRRLARRSRRRRPRRHHAGGRSRASPATRSPTASRPRCPAYVLSRCAPRPSKNGHEPLRLHTHDGIEGDVPQPTESALTLGDQNGDGKPRRSRSSRTLGGRTLRVVFQPAARHPPEMSAT